MFNQLPYWIQFISVMTCVAISDVCWAYYILKAGQKKAFAAATFGTIIIFLSGYSAVSYVHDKSLLIGGMIGAFVGTYITVKYYK